MRGSRFIIRAFLLGFIAVEVKGLFKLILEAPCLCFGRCEAVTPAAGHSSALNVGSVSSPDPVTSDLTGEVLSAGNKPQRKQQNRRRSNTWSLQAAPDDFSEHQSLSQNFIFIPRVPDEDGHSVSLRL